MLFSVFSRTYTEHFPSHFSLYLTHSTEYLVVLHERMMTKLDRAITESSRYCCSSPPVLRSNSILTILGIYTPKLQLLTFKLSFLLTYY